MEGFLVHAKLTKSFALRLGLPISESGEWVLTIELSQEPRGTNAGCWRSQTYIWAGVLHVGWIQDLPPPYVWESREALWAKLPVGGRN